MNNIIKNLSAHERLRKLLQEFKGEIIIPESREHLFSLAMGRNEKNMVFDVSYDVPGKGLIREAYVTKCKNGLAINYDEIYMRRRVPETLIIGDELPTDKVTYKEKYGTDFSQTREETFEWLSGQQTLILLPFYAGNANHNLGYHSLVVLPANAAFFALALSDIQGFIKADEIPGDFLPKAVVYVAPPFRHKLFAGTQTVVHNRLKNVHEIFSYNLYPGPSAKKGIYGVLLNIGEQENWVTLHASTVSCITPYEMVFTIMHEGASGGGKSEMLEQFHRDPNGKLLLGENTVTGETYRLSIADSCTLNPVTDDMAQAHSSLNTGKKLRIVDAEEGWFLRVNHITKYGTEPETERRTIHSEKPLVFFNMDAKPGATCLIWEPIMDAPGLPCPNPRVIMPRDCIPNHINEPVEVDVRSFGLRAPVCTVDKPSYGIAGIFHVLPRALAWLWRLVAPRGDSNPSIVSSSGLESEGVGSYWPFATGKYVTHANLLLEQIISTPSTSYVLIPNSHIGAYKVGFAGQWVAREYLSRRGGTKFKPEALSPSRCPLLGYALESMKVDGTVISKKMLQVNLQSEVGNDGYDKGAKILSDFFKKELKKYLTPELNPLGRKIIEACFNDVSVSDYDALILKDNESLLKPKI